jgi:hypothetical protein
MSDALVYLLQPNLTFPQFGDTENTELQQALLNDVANFRQSGATDAGLRYLEWVASRGQVGEIPPRLDRVWSKSGYAAFRSSWTEHDNAITGHFTCGQLSVSHYHWDETSISLYGYGQEVIVDPGLFSYRKDRLSRYARAGHAHNTLILDDTEHRGYGEASITDSGGVDTDLPWVRGRHSHYADRGALLIARTFAHAKPDVFLVVDHLRSRKSHRLAQRFHLHPSLSVVTLPTPNTVVATGAGPGTPAVVISALPGMDAEFHRGDRKPKDRETAGWYFPAFNVAQETTVVVFRRRFSAGAVDLPILIHVVAPGQPTDSALEYFENTAGKLHLGWRTARGADEAALPAPSP